MTTPDTLAAQIRHLPKLAHDAAQHTIATTHGGSDGTGIRTAPGSKVPPGVDLDRLDLGRGRQWPHLLVRLSECVRVILIRCPALRDTGPALGPEGSETWAGECGWLLATMGTWWDDDWTRSFVESEVTAVGRKLRGSIDRRVEAQAVGRCPSCSAPTYRDDYAATWDDVATPVPVACSGCGRAWTAVDVMTEGNLLRPASLARIAHIIEVPRRTLDRWKSLVKPVSDHEPTTWRPALYLPADFARVRDMMRPGVAESPDCGLPSEPVA